MTVLNSNRVIDACGNTVANSSAKTCTTIVKQPWTNTDTVVASVAGVSVVLFIVVVCVALFRSR